MEGFWNAKGRGAVANPKNRFERLAFTPDPTAVEEERPALTTRFYEDVSESIITYNASPDLPFSASLNPYRGCEHGCSYCYARPSHEYLGFSAGLDFESRIVVKPRAPELLKKELASSRWKPQLIALSGVTDAYQPIEKQLKLTRRCLEVLADFRNPVGVVTKNRLVTRDVDLLTAMARDGLCHVTFSLNSLDAELARKMEPRTSSPKARLEAIRQLASHGVPTGVFIAPVVPGLNDHEIPAILKAAAQAGASYATYFILRLPHGTKDLFFDWMDRAYPTKRARVEERLRHVRGGSLNRSEFGERFSGKGVFAEQIRQLFAVSLKREGLGNGPPQTNTSAFRRTASAQLELGLE